MNEHVVGSGAEPGPKNADSRTDDADHHLDANMQTAAEVPDQSDMHDESDAQLRGVIDEYMSTFAPEPEDTAGVRERILQLVREDLYRGPSTHLQTGRGHPFSISTASVRSIIRVGVDSVDGIRARSVDVEPAGDPEGSAAIVVVTVAMRAGIAFAATAEVIRRSVSAVLLSELGIPAVRIDINAEDVYVD
ncbi:hypothetical protein [Brevibacterium marinum]|uniref:Asp23/Gls24 family envelope stress response protein n=1 Tax=Brevibacterium marinum TaxID=418643 RepID=A0A846S2Z8_9MICO|nr:hypothetical protein [Brevibacterium marinum]NJC55922.1 hypothetical protein [Brevibacterium marinum]